VLRKEGEPSVWTLSPVTLFDRHENRETIRQALTELRRKVSEGDFRLFELRWLGELTVPEIMLTVPWSSGRIRNHLSRMLTKLRRIVTRLSGKGT